MEKVRERYKEIWGIMSNMGREILARVDDEKDPALEKFKNLINILTSISYLSYH